MFVWYRFLFLEKRHFSLLFFLQDILENESINLDWMFRYSLINDIVKVCETRKPVGGVTNRDETRVKEGDESGG